MQKVAHILCMKINTLSYFYACIYIYICTEITALTWRNAAHGEAAMSDGADGGNSLKQNK